MFSIDGFKTKKYENIEGVFARGYGISEISKSRLSKLKQSTILDCGAFIGDTAYIFNKQINPRKICSFEPDPVNYSTLINNLDLNNMQNVIPVKLAIGEEPATVWIKKSGFQSASITSQKTSIEVKTVSIDEYVQKHRLKNIGLIKMDIEGNELPAIKGAIETIKKEKPVLIISVYHKPEDFFEIPPLLKKWVPDYRLKFISLTSKWPIYERVIIAE